MEAGSRNHEVVPTPLIIQLSGLRGGSGVHRAISNLAKTNLVAKVKNAKCMSIIVCHIFFFFLLYLYLGKEKPANFLSLRFI